MTQFNIDKTNPVLAVQGTSMVKPSSIATEGLISNLKLISSGNIPSSGNLLKGQMAFGKITSGDGYYHLYGNSDDTVVDYFNGVARNFSVTYNKDIINKRISVGNYSGSAISFNMSNSLIGSAGEQHRQVAITLESVYHADVYDTTTNELQQSVNILSNFPTSSEDSTVTDVSYIIGMQHEGTTVTLKAKISELVEMLQSASSDIITNYNADYSELTDSNAFTKTQLFMKYDTVQARGTTSEADEILNQIYTEISQILNENTIEGISYDYNVCQKVPLQGELLV